LRAAQVVDVGVYSVDSLTAASPEATTRRYSRPTTLVSTPATAHIAAYKTAALFLATVSIIRLAAASTASPPCTAVAVAVPICISDFSTLSLSADGNRTAGATIP